MANPLKKSLLGVARKVKHGIRSVVDTPQRLRKETRSILEEVSRQAARETGDRHILLASTGVRNIGDQAMLEAFIANVPGQIDVLITSGSSYVIPEEAKHRVTTVRADSLVYGRGSAQRSDLSTFCELLRQARSFSVVGADVIDGGYQLRAPVMSWALATATARAGFDTRVLGFSWGSDVAPIVLDSAKAAQAAGTRLFARDPDSAARLAASGIEGVEEVVDTVFALGGEDTASAEFETVEAIRASGRGYVVMNISGLIASRIDLTADYLRVAREIGAANKHVLLLPHVDNRGGGDIAAVRSFAKLLEQEGIEHTVIAGLLRPKQVRAIARLADAVVTGRMHLSILALSCGVPAIVLSTQGKVSGLMRRIGHPDWCVDPVAGMGDQIIAGLDQAQDLDRTALKAMAPELAAIAKQNFEGLS